MAGGCKFSRQMDLSAAALTAALSIPPGETPALVIALGHCNDTKPERLRKPVA